MTQKQVADQLGVNKSGIVAWEANRRPPIAQFLPKIHDFLGYVPERPTQSFGDQLRARRELVGLSKKQLANRLGISHTTVGKWENGTKPTQESLTLVEGFFAK